MAETKASERAIKLVDDLELASMRVADFDPKGESHDRGVASLKVAEGRLLGTKDALMTYIAALEGVVAAARDYKAAQEPWSKNAALLALDPALAHLDGLVLVP